MAPVKRWTEEQVVAAAPDVSSVAAARRLASPGPWADLGANDVLVWGRCQGSGKTPYQVSVDVLAPAYRCSCPSRKFPCKHALALLMLWSRGPDVVPEGDAADHAKEWANQRAERSSKQESRNRERGARPVDPEAQARRLAERVALMDDGVADFRLWLTDVVRAGLAAARNQPYSWWDTTAARLVDAQLPGLADRVRTMGSAIHSRSDWADHLLAGLGRWWLVTCAWRSRETLDPDTEADLRVALGWSQPSATIRERESISGPWHVMGAHRTDDGRLQQQRTWLRGTAGPAEAEMLQVLDFAAYGEALATPQLPGTVIDADLARYPGRSPRRATFVSDVRPVAESPELPSGTTITSAVAAAAAALAGSPWRDRHPAVLADVRVDSDGWSVRDAEDAVLKLVEDAPVWHALALTGGAPADVFGEIEDGRFRPLTVAFAGQVRAL
jgi:hypothetical protein